MEFIYLIANPGFSEKPELCEPKVYYWAVYIRFPISRLCTYCDLSVINTVSQKRKQRLKNDNCPSLK